MLARDARRSFRLGRSIKPLTRRQALDLPRAYLSHSTTHSHSGGDHPASGSHLRLALGQEPYLVVETSFQRDRVGRYGFFAQRHLRLHTFNSHVTVQNILFGIVKGLPLSDMNSQRYIWLPAGLFSPRDGNGWRMDVQHLVTPREVSLASASLLGFAHSPIGQAIGHFEWCLVDCTIIMADDAAATQDHIPKFTIEPNSVRTIGDRRGSSPLLGYPTRYTSATVPSEVSVRLASAGVNLYGASLKRST